MATAFPELQKFIRSEAAAKAGVYKAGIPLSELKGSVIVIDTTEWVVRLCQLLAQRNPRGVLLCDHEAPGGRLLGELLDADVDNYIRHDLAPFYVFPGLHKNLINSEEPERKHHRKSIEILQKALSSTTTTTTTTTSTTTSSSSGEAPPSLSPRDCTYHYYLSHLDAIITRAMRHLAGRHVECMRAPYYAWTQATFLSVLFKDSPVHVYGTLHLGITRPQPCILDIDFAAGTYALLDTAALRKFLAIDALLTPQQAQVAQAAPPQGGQRDDAARRVTTAAAVLSGFNELTPQRTEAIADQDSTQPLFVRVARMLIAKQAGNKGAPLGEKDFREAAAALYVNPVVVDLLTATIMIHLHGPILNRNSNCSIFSWLNDAELTVKLFGQKLPDTIFFILAFAPFAAAPFEAFTNGKLEQTPLLISSEDAIAVRKWSFSTFRRKAFGLLAPALKNITGFTALREKCLSSYLPTKIGPFEPIIPLYLK